MFLRSSADQPIKFSSMDNRSHCQCPCRIVNFHARCSLSLLHKYYSALVVAEAIGSSNTSQIVDLNANNGNEFTPAYAIYEQGTVARVALFNYITDESGASDYTASISIGDATPGQVRVKYECRSSSRLLQILIISLHLIQGISLPNLWRRRLTLHGLAR